MNNPFAPQYRSCCRPPGINSLAGRLDNDVAGVVDTVGVVAEAAVGGVGAGDGLEDVVAAAAVQVVIPRAAEDVVVAAVALELVVALAQVEEERDVHADY